MKLLELPTFVWQHATLYVGCANKCFVWPNSDFECSTCAQLEFGKHNSSLAKRNFVFRVSKQVFRFAKF